MAIFPPALYLVPVNTQQWYKIIWCQKDACASLQNQLKILQMIFQDIQDFSLQEHSEQIDSYYHTKKGSKNVISFIADYVQFIFWIYNLENYT